MPSPTRILPALGLSTLLALCLAQPARAGGEAAAAGAKPPPASASTACPAPEALQASDLYGLWRAEFEPAAMPVTLLLERHPELAGSVRGLLQRQGVRAWVSGDVDDGDFTLEESANGRNISATWLGEVSPDSCGREIKGTWRSEAQPDKPLRFVLKKVEP